MKLVPYSSVVDRHRVDADPDPNFHVDADPDPGPDWIGIRNDPHFLVVTALPGYNVFFILRKILGRHKCLLWLCGVCYVFFVEQVDRIIATFRQLKKLDMTPLIDNFRPLQPTNNRKVKNLNYPLL